MIPLGEFFHLYRTAIADKEKELAWPLIQGEAEDFPHYKQQSGMIAGLNMAREMFDDLVKKANEGPL